MTTTHLAPIPPTAPNAPNGDSFKDWLERAEPAIEKIASRHLSTGRLLKIALVARQKTPALQKCSPQSFLLALMEAAEAGLEPNTPLEHAALVPYRNSHTGQMEVRFEFMYKGLIHLARRTGLVRNAWARLVYEKEWSDEGRWKWGEGLEPSLFHKPILSADRGDVAGAYAVAHMYDGPREFTVMRRDELDEVRDQSPSKNGPWKKHFGAMCKKTAIKRLLSGMDLDAETAGAIAVEGRAQDEGDDLSEVIQ
jgi:recombination protein RecT